MSNHTPPPRITWSSRIARHWRKRKYYGRTIDWIWSLYNRILISRVGRYFPLRGRLRPVHLSQLKKPLWIRLGTTDWLVLEEIFIRAEYDPVLKENLGDVRQIVDLGSNIGLSIRLWQSNFPSAKIVGVEPDDRNLEVCRRNAAEVDSNSVALIHACVAAVTRTVYLKREQGEWAITMTDQQTGEIGVPAKTIPAILAEAGMSGDIDLLKVDIEGAEKELFSDCREWIGRVKTIIVELHHPYHQQEFLHDLARGGGDFDCQVLDSDANFDVLLLRRRNPSGGMAA
jgi:FkbM family methyltransferase